MKTLSGSEQSTSGRLQVFMQILGSVTAAQGMASSALSSAWAIVANWQLRQDVGGLGLTTADRAWVMSVAYLSSGVGCLISGWLGKRFGSRNAILLSLPLRTMGSAVIALSPSYLALLAGRLLVGFASGIPTALAMDYIGATAAPRYRGALSLVTDLSCMGQVIGIIVLGEYLSWWWLEVYIGAVVTVPTALLLLLLPSDPVWLLARGKLEQAQRSARRFGSEVHASLSNSSTPEERNGTANAVKLLTKRKNVLPLAVVLFTVLLSAFSGFIALRAYSLEFFQRAGVPISATVSACLFCGIRAAGALVALCLIDRFGRRVLMMTSSAGMFVCYVLLLVYYNVKSLHDYPIIPVALLLPAALMYAIGIGCVPWVLAGEIFPIHMRQIGGSLQVAFYSISSYASVFTFPIILENVGESGLFIVLTCTVVVVFLFELLLVPETRGLTIAQIEGLFVSGGSPPQTTTKSAPVGAGGLKQASSTVGGTCESAEGHIRRSSSVTVCLEAKTIAEGREP